MELEPKQRKELEKIHSLVNEGAERHDELTSHLEPVQMAIPVKCLVRSVFNPRQIYRDIVALADDIRQRGIDTPLSVHLPWRKDAAAPDLTATAPPVAIECLKGHRRMAAAQMLVAQGVWTGDTLVPVLAYQELTEKERYLLVNDHGQQSALTRQEVATSAGYLASAGLSPRAICLRLEGCLETLQPMPAKAKERLDKLQGDAYAKELYTIRKGFLDPMLWVHRLPESLPCDPKVNPRALAMEAFGGGASGIRIADILPLYAAWSSDTGVGSDVGKPLAELIKQFTAKDRKTVKRGGKDSPIAAEDVGQSLMALGVTGPLRQLGQYLAQVKGADKAPIVADAPLQDLKAMAEEHSLLSTFCPAELAELVALARKRQQEKANADTTAEHAEEAKAIVAENVAASKKKKG